MGREMGLVCAGLLSVTILACQRPEPKPFVRPVRAMRIGDTSQVSRGLPGRARAVQEVNLSFRVSGPLVELPVDVGDVVEKGRSLARIDPRDYQVKLEDAQGRLARAEASLAAMQAGARSEELKQLQALVESAEAAYGRAYSEYGRAAELVKTRAISQEEFDRKRQIALKANADLRTAQEELRIGQIGAREEDIRAQQAEIRSLRAAVAAAEDQLGDTELKAPFPGVVAAKYVENFETVQANQVIVRLLDVTQVEIVINVPETAISVVPYAKDITCTFDAFPDKPVPAQIKEIGTEASQTTRTYPVTLVMNQPEGFTILPGMAGVSRGRVELPGDAARQGYEVPETAVFSPEQGEHFVWLIDPASKATRRQAVRLGELTPRGIRVAGVMPGQWIATAGVHYLEEGQTVEILPEPGTEVPSAGGESPPPRREATPEAGAASPPEQPGPPAEEVAS